MKDSSIEYQQSKKFWIVRASEGVEGDNGGGKKLFKRNNSWKISKSEERFEYPNL